MKRAILLLIILVIARFAVPFIKAVIQELKNSEEDEADEAREENEESEENKEREEYICAPRLSGTCTEIAKIISHHDGKVMKDMEEMIADPISYFCDDDDLSAFEKKLLREQEVNDDTIWLGMVRCLERNNYVCERDGSDELEDFICFLNDLKYEIKVDKEGLDEDGGVSQWCEELDKRIQAENMCIGDIDINSDSYVLFFCEESVLERLNGLAQSIGRRITFAREM